MPNKYSESEGRIWKDALAKDLHAYNGELAFAKDLILDPPELSLIIQKIRYTEILVVNKFDTYFRESFSKSMGILGIVCIITDLDNNYFLGGRRSRPGKWHYNRLCLPGGLIELETLKSGLYEAIMHEVREEVKQPLELTSPRIIGVSTGRLGLYTNLFIHLQAPEVDVDAIIPSNYEFIDKELQWHKYNDIHSLPDEELFGGAKFVKYLWEEYLNTVYIRK